MSYRVARNKNLTEKKENDVRSGACGTYLIPDSGASSSACFVVVWGQKKRQECQHIYSGVWHMSCVTYHVYTYIFWKTSAVSTTDWMVETQLCKLRGTSDTYIRVTKITCERWQRSGPIRPTLKSVHFTKPFSSASPFHVLHFGKLGDAVQCFSICAHLTRTRHLACEQSYEARKLCPAQTAGQFALLSKRYTSRSPSRFGV